MKKIITILLVFFISFLNTNAYSGETNSQKLKTLRQKIITQSGTLNENQKQILENIQNKKNSLKIQILKQRQTLENNIREKLELKLEKYNNLDKNKQITIYKSIIKKINSNIKTEKNNQKIILYKVFKKILIEKIQSLK